MKKQALFFVLIFGFLGHLGYARAQEVGTIFSERLNIYGYGLFDFCITSKGEFLPGLPFECRKGGSFAQVLFAPFLDFKITERARFFSEIEFEYVPEYEIFGEVEWEKENDEWEGPELDPKGAEEVKIEGFGEIDVAFAAFEYYFFDLLKIRAGKYLNPFGLILERRDASPSYPFLFRPLMYEKVEGYRIIPFYNAGIQLRGEIPYFGYVVHLSNGKGSVANIIDTNQDKAVGVHLFGRVPSGILEGSLLGFDFYTIDDIKKIENNTLGAHSILSISGIGPGKIQLWGELANTKTGAEGEVNILTWYALLSYIWFLPREWTLTPFVMYENYKASLKEKEEPIISISNIVFGLNVSPFSQLVLKLEFRNQSVKGEEKGTQIFGFGIAYSF